MEELQKRAKELLSEKKVGIIVGYEKGTGSNIRPAFILKPEDSGKLIFSDYCKANLSVYLLKHEVRKQGKIGIVSNLSVLRSILQLLAEQQLKAEDFYILFMEKEGKLKEFSTIEELEGFIRSTSFELTSTEKKALEEVEKMSLEEKWNYWQKELERCLKCYACRAACPFCYCTKCAVECNQPQWISSAAHSSGNFEWHLTRAMHLAGRCVNCGECGRVCPLEIPIDLLTRKISEEVYKNFGLRAGLSQKAEYALATFKPGDKENFIR